MVDEDKKQIAHEIFKTIPYLNLIGMELVDVNPGEAIVRLKMRDDLRQPHGLLHGGATASLVDTAMAFALVTVLDEEEKASTIDLTIHYLRPVINETVICTAKVVKAGKRISTLSAEVVNEEGKLVATALSSYTKI